MSKARNLANLISDGLVDTAEIADGAITQAKIDAGVDLGGGATGGGSDEIFYENGQTVTADYTITSGSNAMTVGPVTVNTGVVVTVPTGSRYVVI